MATTEPLSSTRALQQLAPLPDIIIPRLPAPDCIYGALVVPKELIGRAVASTLGHPVNRVCSRATDCMWLLEFVVD